MAKQLLTAVLAAASTTTVGAIAAGMYTVSGACDVHGGVNGQKFFMSGYTASGAPWYKALDSETYMYFDPDCQGSTDGVPRWVIDHDKPDIYKASDLDSDHFCDYVGRIDSKDVTGPPIEGRWTLNCGGSWEEHYVILLEGPEMYVEPPATSVRLTGACAPEKSFLNNLVFTEVAETADGRPFFKAQGREEYIYYDADCDGIGGGSGAGRWILDNSRPSTTATEDLDGDHACDYHARVDSSRHRPPSAAVWRMYCGEPHDVWTDVQLRLTAVNSTGAAVSSIRGTAVSSIRGAAVSSKGAVVSSTGEATDHSADEATAESGKPGKRGVAQMNSARRSSSPLAAALVAAGAWALGR